MKKITIIIVSLLTLFSSGSNAVSGGNAILIEISRETEPSIRRWLPIYHVHDSIHNLPKRVSSLPLFRFQVYFSNLPLFTSKVC